VIAVFGEVTYRQLKTGDFSDHIVWAHELVDKGYLFRPAHQLFQQLVIIVRAFLPFNYFVRINQTFKQIIDLKSYEISTMVIITIVYVITAIIIYKQFIKEWDATKTKNNYWLAGGSTLAVMLISPIFLFTLPDQMYLGYINGNPFHNPTYLLLRPFALLLFLHTIKNLYSKSHWSALLIAGILIVLGTMSKASFTLTFLPAVGFYVIIHLRNFRKFNWPYLISGLAIPGSIILGMQFVLSYFGNSDDSIIFAPFQAILNYVPNIGLVLIFILLSILSPLILTLLYWKQVCNEPTLQLAWVNFLTALIPALFFSERINWPSINFWWGPMCAVFILFVVTVSVAGKNKVFCVLNPTDKLKKWIVLSIFGLHLICGIIYYFSSVFFPAPII